MKADATIRVVELRNYLLRPGARERFVEHFAARFVAAQNALGGFVLGGFRLAGAPDRFVWLRGFAGMAARGRFLPAFYGGETWREHGPAANEMMLEYHDAHLLRPLAEMRVEDFRAVRPALTVVDLYAAAPGAFSALLDSRLAAAIDGAAARTDFWVTERAANDFPRLPVIQRDNLLVTATNIFDAARAPAPPECGASIAGHERLMLTPALEIYERNFSNHEANKT